MTHPWPIAPSRMTNPDGFQAWKVPEASRPRPSSIGSINHLGPCSGRLPGIRRLMKPPPAGAWTPLGPRTLRVPPPHASRVAGRHEACPLALTGDPAQRRGQGS